MVHRNPPSSRSMIAKLLARRMVPTPFLVSDSIPLAGRLDHDKAGTVSGYRDTLRGLHDGLLGTTFFVLERYRIKDEEGST